MDFHGIVTVMLLVGSIIFSSIVMCWGCGGLLGIVGDRGGGRSEDPLGLHLLLLACFWWSLGCQLSGN